MKDFKNLDVVELDFDESLKIDGGGPIKDGLSWYFQTVGSFYRGLWDGLVGNEPAV